MQNDGFIQSSKVKISHEHYVIMEFARDSEVVVRSAWSGIEWLKATVLAVLAVLKKLKWPWWLQIKGKAWEDELELRPVHMYGFLF